MLIFTLWERPAMAMAAFHMSNACKYQSDRANLEKCFFFRAHPGDIVPRPRLSSWRTKMFATVPAVRPIIMEISLYVMLGSLTSSTIRFTTAAGISLGRWTRPMARRVRVEWHGETKGG